MFASARTLPGRGGSLGRSQTDGEDHMQWERIERNWRQFRGAVRAHWTLLTEEQLSVIDGKRPVLVKKIVEIYNITEAQTERAVTAWANDLSRRPSALRKRP
jgi:uncharacterized protein YjbJ (UPF0337 family)